MEPGGGYQAPGPPPYRKAAKGSWPNKRTYKSPGFYKNAAAI